MPRPSAVLLTEEMVRADKGRRSYCPFASMESFKRLSSNTRMRSSTSASNLFNVQRLDGFVRCSLGAIE